MTDLTTINNQLPAAFEDLARFVLIGRDRMASVRAEISAINRLGLAQEVRQQKLAEAQQISEIVLDAEVKLGELISAMPKAKNQYESASNNAVTSTKEQALREIGFDKMQANRLETLAKHPEVVAQAKAEAREADDIVSRSFVLEKIKAKEREEDVKANLASISSREVKRLDGKYDAIVIDPPWPMQKIERDVRPNQIMFDYPTMTEEELNELHIPAADDCHMWLWTTHKFLPMAFRLLDKWGFKYVCTFVWHKPGGFQPYGLPQYNCEFALYARKGTPKFIDTAAFNTCFNAPRGAHSEKPGEFYDVVRRVTSGSRADMFNRRKIDGFEGWGNEAV